VRRLEMKIAAVFGSPRKGMNSETLAEAFLGETERLGAEVGRFRLGDLKYRGCIGCGGCKTGSEECVLKDGLSKVLDAVRGADTLLLATPVYFVDVPSQFKGFVDRWYSFFKPNFQTRDDKSRLPAGRNVVMVVTQGAPEGAFWDFVQRYDRVLTNFGFKRMHLIRGCGLRNEPDVAANRPELLEAAREAARRVMAGKPSTLDLPPPAPPAAPARR
jgi:multimeric flavodoxin WrbA